MNLVSRLCSYLLLIAAAGMAAWGTLGFIEYFTGVALVFPLRNPNFPSGTQFIHWFSYYVVFSIYLFKSERMQKHFGRDAGAEASPSKGMSILDTRASAR